MAVTATTANPTLLLNNIKAAIASNKVITWHLVREIYFTHSPDQWENRAFFRAAVQLGTLVFNIVPPQGMKVSTEVYAVYHGRLVEMLLAHFDREFTQVFASAMPITGDSIG